MCSWAVSAVADYYNQTGTPIFGCTMCSKCDVRWNAKYSQRFSIFNGVKQGSISSPILWSCYINKLILKLRALKIGCQIGGEFLGILVYADDIFLLSASQMGPVSYTHLTLPTKRIV